MRKTMKITEDKINGTFEGFTPFQVKCEKGYVIGTYQHNEDRLCISHAMCQGCLKELINYLVNKFKTNDILLYNIMNISAWNMLRGFNPIIMEDSVFKESVLCLEGKWETEKATAGDFLSPKGEIVLAIPLYSMRFSNDKNKYV